MFAALRSGANSRWGNGNATRETMLDCLNDGMLNLEVHLRTNKQAERPKSFVPSNPFNDNMLKVFNMEEVSNIKFEVGGKAESVAANRRKRKRDKNKATAFHASHVILVANAPALADMCNPDDEAAVPINGVEPEVFKTMLYFCYGGRVSEEELAANAKAIIEASDRFGILSTSSSRPRPC